MENYVHDTGFFSKFISSFSIISLIIDKIILIVGNNIGSWSSAEGTWRCSNFIPDNFSPFLRLATFSSLSVLLYLFTHALEYFCFSCFTFHLNSYYTRPQITKQSFSISCTLLFSYMQFNLPDSHWNSIGKPIKPKPITGSSSIFM